LALETLETIHACTGTLADERRTSVKGTSACIRVAILEIVWAEPTVFSSDKYLHKTQRDTLRRRDKASWQNWP
jgi:hypothetical protein